MKNMLFLFVILAPYALFARDFKFLFVYSYGLAPSDNTLIFYQLIDKFGKPGEMTPVSITNNKIEKLPLNDLKNIVTISFSGYVLKDNDRKKIILVRNLSIKNLNRGDVNRVELIAADVSAANYTPVPELLRLLSQKRYNEILAEDKSERLNYDYVVPLGHFILYDEKNQNNIQDADILPADNPFFVESSKSITDEYVLKKDIGASLNIGYKDLAGASTDISKSQYIKYLVSIDTMQIIHWQSDKSELQFLSREVASGKLNYLIPQFSNNPNLKFYFISSCIKIKGYKLFSQTEDSLSTSAAANVSLGGNPNTLTVRAGVVYISNEGNIKLDETDTYYCGFTGRDYTTSLKIMLNVYDHQQKINAATASLNNTTAALVNQYKDFVKINPTMLNYSDPDLIASFVDNLNNADFVKANDSLPAAQKAAIEAQNAQISGFNAALKVLKESSAVYRNAKNYYHELIADKQNIPSSLPEPVPLSNKIVEAALKSPKNI